MFLKNEKFTDWYNKIMHCMKNKSLHFRILKKLKIEKCVGNKFEDIRGIILHRKSKIDNTNTTMKTGSQVIRKGNEYGFLLPCGSVCPF